MMSGSSSRVLSVGKGFEVVEDLDPMEEGACFTGEIWGFGGGLGAFFLPFLSRDVAWERRGRVVMLDSRSHHLFGPPLGLELCPSLK